MAMWLNVDTDPREYSCRLHRDNCGSIRKTPTPFKGIGEIKKDGGWLHFETVGETKAWHREKYPGIPWKLFKKKKCFGKENE
jgi:hypothetical protein